MAPQAALLVGWCIVLSFANSGGSLDKDYFDAETLAKARVAAKPWYLRSFKINGIGIISPATLVIIIVAIVNLCWGMRSKPTWAEASHILIEDHSKATKKMLVEMQKDIGSDYIKFGQYAAKYSKCPSKNNQGALGRFQKGDMAPTFDKAVFDPASSVGATLGPIETPFGWHLIYITQRKLNLD
jgi:peptidyl-prolyl cis-trans isomerase C